MYWGIGLGLGLALAGGFVVADAYAGLLRPGWWALYPALVLSGMGTVVTLAGLGKGLAWALVEWDEWQTRKALTMAAASGGDEPDDEPDDTESERAHGWQVALLHSIMYADRYGWTFDSLGPTGINIMERTAWDAVTNYLRDCGRLVKKDRSRTRYAVEWDGPRLRDEIRRWELPLPFPLGSAPDVHAPRCTEAVLHRMAMPAQKGSEGVEVVGEKGLA